MYLRKTSLYFLAGAIVPLVTFAGLAYLGMKATHPPHLPEPQTMPPGDSPRPGAGPVGEPGELRPLLCDSLYQEGMTFVDEDRFYEAFERIRAAFEQDPTQAKYRKTLVTLQRLSSADFALQQTEGKMKSPAAATRLLEDLLAEAQAVQQRVAQIDMEADEMPAPFVQAKERLRSRASNLIEAVAYECREGALQRELDEAWRRLDWDGLAGLLAQARGQGLREASRAFQQLIRTTKEVLEKYQAYSSAKSSQDLTTMAELLPKMVTALSDANHPARLIRAEPDRYSQFRAWLEQERESLLPRLKPRIEKLCQDAVELVAEYAMAPITTDEINGWTADTDFGPVRERALLLSKARVQLAEAAALAAMPAAGQDYPALLNKTELEIVRICRAGRERAYIFEKSYGDVHTAAQIHRIVAALPDFENNDYPRAARQWLAEFEGPAGERPPSHSLQNAGAGRPSGVTAEACGQTDAVLVDRARRKQIPSRFVGTWAELDESSEVCSTLEITPERIEWRRPYVSLLRMSDGCPGTAIVMGDGQVQEKTTRIGAAELLFEADETTMVFRESVEDHSLEVDGVPLRGTVEGRITAQDGKLILKCGGRWKDFISPAASMSVPTPVYPVEERTYRREEQMDGARKSE